jgi:histidyl-tRNA synthetase
MVGALRSKSLAADFSYKRQPLGKQLKEANRRGARCAVIIRSGTVSLKNLQTGQQSDVPLQEFMSEPARYLVSH